ncbi:hypothetical protein HPB50_024528 [Hyalomma asiaticum]|uniref:Uncharacterized protein n=1 Tax=Hyalomma asiaticum TaxID=266040 RepID=A0ACB7SHL5_HYAAI|nr:hypothetical protein HPB50_024528 [Hyalomma asiaticum]
MPPVSRLGARGLAAVPLQPAGVAGARDPGFCIPGGRKGGCGCSPEAFLPLAVGPLSAPPSSSSCYFASGEVADPPRSGLASARRAASASVTRLAAGAGWRASRPGGSAARCEISL